MFSLRPDLLALALAAAALLGGCGCEEREERGGDHPMGPPPPNNPYIVPFETMGTTGAVTVMLDGLDEAAAREAAGKAVAAAQRVAALMSAYDAESEVSRFNKLAAGETMTLSPETAEVVALALETWRASGGRFDVTVGPLVRLYRPLIRQYQVEGREVALPDEARIREALARVGSGHLAFDAKARTLAKKVAGVELDLGAVAKGFGVDAAAEALGAAGAERALVELGGEVRALGEKAPGVPWRVAVRHPRGAGSMAAIELADRAVATSGDYEQYFETGGARYSHIVDPRTGLPVRARLVSATVVARECARADALATCLCAWGGKEKLEAILEGLGAAGVEALVVREGGDGALSIERTPGLTGLDVDLEGGAR